MKSLLKSKKIILAVFVILIVIAGIITTVKVTGGNKTRQV